MEVKAKIEEGHKRAERLQRVALANDPELEVNEIVPMMAGQLAAGFVRERYSDGPFVNLHEVAVFSLVERETRRLLEHTDD